MPIPTQTEMFPLVLEVMSDGETRANKEIKEAVSEHLGLTTEERKHMTKSGEPIYSSRTGWAVQYLHRAQLFDRVSRGVYRINSEGREVAARQLAPSELSSYMNTLIAQRNPWNTGSYAQSTTESKQEEALSPQETIEEALSDLRSTLSDELLDIIMAKPPEFFEKIVVDLLVKMGYGTGEVTQYSNDGGIDGIITTDALGFDPIYTQAKRYASDHKVSRPELQGFAGALGHYTRGIFITTSTFAETAIEFARTFPHATIVLIDGHKLAELMIDYNLGVSTERTYMVKRIDIDYFEQD